MFIAVLALNLMTFVGSGSASSADDMRQVVGATCNGNTRVFDGSWQHGLFLNPRVSLDEATMIVRAIRRGDVANRQRIPSTGPLAGIAPVMPFIDADQITSISDERFEDGSRAFNVKTGCMSGRSYLIVLVNKMFELREVRAWIA
jgi:hypothetical protein